MPNKPKRELVRFHVGEVSVVDSPAIEEPFALTKSKGAKLTKAEGDGMAEGGAASGAPAATGSLPPAGNVKAPVHAALLAEKVEGFKEAAQGLTAVVADLDASDPTELEERLKLFQETGWRISDMVYGITRFIRETPNAVLTKSRTSRSLRDQMDGMNKVLDAIAKATTGEEPTADSGDPTMGTCTECGAELAQGAKFCSQCGVATTAKAEQPDPKATGAAANGKKPEDEDPDTSKAAGAAANGKKPEDEEVGKGAAGKPEEDAKKKLTPDQMAKMAGSLGTLADLCKEMGVDSIDDLAKVASGSADVAKRIAKAADGATAAEHAEYARLQKRVKELEDAGIPRGLPEGQSATLAKSESVFGGLGLL